MRWGALTAALLLGAARLAQAQGGPPMITDDPGTPGDRKWEINLATAFEHRAEETAWDAPAIDLNYGVGDCVQLTLQTAPVLLKREGHGLVGGLGSAEAAVKWRFLDEERAGVAVSTFPRVIFSVLQSSVRRGLAEDGTRFQLPVQAARKFGPVGVNLEFGPLVSTVGRSEWLYGLVGGVALGKRTALMAELHGTARTNLSRDVLAVNVGLRQELTATRILILSLGHEVRAPGDESRAFFGYAGMQLLY